MHSVNFIQLTPMGLGKQTEIEIIDKKHLCTDINETNVLTYLWVTQLLFTTG